MIFTITFFKKR